MGNTVKLHRVLKAPAERVYKAFLDPDAMVKWLPPHGFTGKVHEMDATVGGKYKMSFTNFSNGQSHSFGGEYLELEPGKLIKNTDRFDSPDLPGEMTKQIFVAPARNIRSTRYSLTARGRSIPSSRRLPTGSTPWTIRGCLVNSRLGGSAP